MGGRVSASMDAEDGPAPPVSVVDVGVDEVMVEEEDLRDSKRRITSEARRPISSSSWGVGCTCGEDVCICAYRLANSYKTLQCSNASDIKPSFS